ncbi:putative heat shock protein [Methanosarcina sp. MTP4]|uniref:archaeal heat shock protein Hsp20 n=1 Tax=Methanosarcina sp. MTP4 TaxID=1434100 RepID=UPI000615B19D|nr:archaeal heat shock protein Hsp20 [Methanosarcina sp. MTP4]AKB23542.1 putative heat shock protein [Methanosarcina sp. MTP4]
MVGARKRKDFFEDFGSELFDNLEEMIDALLDEMGESSPFVYGFSIIHRPGEDPEIREFGNVSESSQEEGDFVSPEAKEPLIDVFETDETVQVLAEFPEAEKEDVCLRATASSLEIMVSGLSGSYSENVELPVPVDPKSAKASYKNGVLEVTFRRYLEEGPITIDIE